MREKVVDLLKRGGVGVLATDTIYGLVGSALAPDTIEEAKNYFGDKVDFYLDGGQVLGLPSTLVAIEDGELAIKRSGEANVIE